MKLFAGGRTNGIFAIVLILLFILSGCGNKTVSDEKLTEVDLQEIIQFPDGMDEGWLVTQYGHADGAQYMFYTIEDKDGHVILIDGGHNEGREVEDVKTVIKQHNNHVDAWIITHMHPDHAGAFNTIMTADKEITVDNIYTIDVNDARYRETARDYDGIEVYDSFIKVINEIDKTKTNVNYVHEGDTLDCIGLEIDILHSWDESTDKLEKNLMNNGSMVFLVKGIKETILFLSDAEDETEEDLYKAHSKEVSKANYIQLAHHGNWGMTIDFYMNTNPQIVFFNAPDFIFQPKVSGKKEYDASILKTYFENNEVEVYTMHTAPNMIILR